MINISLHKITRTYRRDPYQVACLVAGTMLFFVLVGGAVASPAPATLLLDVAAPLLPGGHYYAPSATGSSAGEASWQALH